MDGTVDFYRYWANYKLGFGEARSEHWLGNDNIHILTNIHDANELRIDMESAANEKAYAQYASFSIDSEEDNFELHVVEYNSSSTAGK